jgi:Barstar (barnase inhibitor)
MTADMMWTLGGPSLSILPTSAEGSVLEGLPPSGVSVVARLDGAAMVESDDVFREFSSALKFPAYFGWNWAALSDCLRDLSWREADRYLILINRAEETLSGSSEERDLLFHTLAVAVKDWANPLGNPDGEGTPFKVVLVCSDDAVDAMRAEVARY